MNDTTPRDSSQDDDASRRPEPPRYGEYAPPGWTPPEPQQQWTPTPEPPTPGLIALRPLQLSDILSGTVRVFRRHAGPTYWFALAVAAVTTIVTLAFVLGSTWSRLATLDPTSTPDVESLRALLVPLLLAVCAAVVVQVVILAIPQAIIITTVARGTLGERPRMRELWSRSRGRIGALVAWMLLISGGLAIVVTGAVLGLVELALSGGVAPILAAAGLTLLLAVVVLVIAFWLGTKLAFVPALIVLERLPIAAAVRRSWSLTIGSFWRVLGTMLLTSLIVQVGAQIITMPLSGVTRLVDPSLGLGLGLDGNAIALLVILLIVQIAVTAVAIVVQTAVPTLLYLDARMRREGFDADLRRHAEERAANEPGAADPFV